MKKLLLSILILATVGTYAQNVNFTSSSFKNHLLGQSSINTNNDTEIQVSEAQAFTGTINCTGSLISDMTGLEAFVNLTELYCGGNTFTSLDVSANTALELLNCGVIASLSSLDLSQNVNLTNLGIEYCGFTTIDLSANTLLTELNIRNNQFSSIDLSTNVNLEEITFDNNSITSIDLSNNLGLTKVRGNQNLIEQLDLSLHSSLDYLFLSSNNLTSLNVANGNNVNFQTLSGPGGSSSPAFNVTSNQNLTCIQVDDAAWSTTNWTSIDAASSFSESCTTVGVEEEETLAFGMYPNPTSGELNFTSNQPIEFIEIFNQVGQQITVFTNQNAVNITELATGFYTVRITSGTKTGVQRLIKE
jgi:hypothetical protein